MISFKRYLEEVRKVDPVKLSKRVYHRYGQDIGGRTEHDGKVIPFDLDPDDQYAPGHVAHHRFIQHSEDNPAWKKDLVSTKLPTRSLKPSQGYVHVGDEKQLRKKIYDDDEPPTVVKHEGEHYVINGHHRVWGKKLRGEKHITVKVLDLDKRARPFKGHDWEQD